MVPLPVHECHAMVHFAKRHSHVPSVRLREIRKIFHLTLFLHIFCSFQARSV
jgi:hypothetical protein